MLAARAKAEAQGRKAKLTSSYQELLDEFSQKDLKSVGNYTLGRLIGKGSFGKVYLASHKLTNGSKVVLKSAKKDDSNLAREIHHHRQFVHPHIARLYEVIVTETMVWLVLEYCQGDELYNHLLKHGRLPVDKVQKIFTQLVGAVSYVHLQSCVHRDLKLENILLDKHENVKLVDFGFTREYEGKANYLQTFCGTICYSAPEMLKGEKYAGEKVDVWSLGIILYALLCGELPFDDDDDDVTRRRILTEEPAYPEHIPADALALIKLMLSKRPLIRPALPDILGHAFLAEHAPQQQAILKLQRPSPFSTALEKETLERMRSAGVDIDSVIESVLAQRCDALAGWWTLLIEKEQRKHARRERKRKEKELERRSSRRLSGASSRLERLATVGEEGGQGGQSGQGGLGPGIVMLGDPPTPKSLRGRSQRRSGTYELRIEDFPGLKELGQLNDPSLSLQHQQQQQQRRLSQQVQQQPHQPQPPPTPVDKDSVRSASSSRHRRPIPPPKEGVLRSARSRGSTLHLVTTTEALAAVKAAQGGGRGGEGGRPGGNDCEDDEDEDGQRDRKVRKKTSQVIITHWKNMTHWIVESARRNKGAGRRGGSHSTPNLVSKPGSGGKDGKDGRGSKDSSPRPQTSKYPNSSSAGMASKTASLPRGVIANGFAARGGSSGGGGGIGVGGGGGGSGGGETSAGVSSSGLGGLIALERPDCGIESGHGNGNGNGNRSRSGSGNANLNGYSNSINAGISRSSSSSHRNGGSQRYNNIGGNAGAIGYGGQAPRLQTSSSYKRQSLSPSPLTPRSTVRRTSAASHGLRGRKSTSSSVSSIRSIHHHHQHSHSKASSTSSNGSVSTSMSKTPLPAGRSPHHSVKVLPATPTTTSFPSNLRLVRGSMGGGGGGGGGGNAFNEGMPLGRAPGSPNPFAFGGGGGGGGTPVMFAKRKRNIFKGPMLSFGGSGGGGGGGGHGHGSGGIGIGSGVRIGSGSMSGSSIGIGIGIGTGISAAVGSHSRSASASGLGRRSGEITIAEEDEEEMEEEDDDLEGLEENILYSGERGEFDGIEEVEAFSPVIQRPGELVEEIYEDDDEGGEGGEDGEGERGKEAEGPKTTA